MFGDHMAEPENGPLIPTGLKRIRDAPAGPPMCY
jgi:hypothetical protein